MSNKNVLRYEAYTKSPSTGKWAWRGISKKGYDKMIKMGFGEDKVRRKQSNVGAAHYRVRHVVEKVGASDMNDARKAYLHKLEQERAWILLARDSARTAAEKKKLSKELAKVKAEERAITGLGKKKRR